MNNSDLIDQYESILREFIQIKGLNWDGLSITLDGISIDYQCDNSTNYRSQGTIFIRIGKFRRMEVVVSGLQGYSNFFSVFDVKFQEFILKGNTLIIKGKGYANKPGYTLNLS